MTTREIEHALDAGQWHFIDMSSESASFGFHYKMLPGNKYMLLLSTGGTTVDDDYLYPVTTKWVDHPEGSEQNRFMVSLMEVNLPSWFDPTDGDEDNQVAVVEAMDGPEWETVHVNLGRALKFADWLAANLK